MTAFISQLALTFKWAIRDRLFYAVFGVAILLLGLSILMSSFSMRQVQELSITLALSFNSLFLLILGILLGTSSLWREIERRYTHSVLTLPISRGSYLLGKFCGLSLFLMVCTVILAVVAAVVVALGSASYPSDVPVSWNNFFLAAIADGLKSILIAAIALLFSTVATSFYLPFFASLAVYFAGSATQEVYEYLFGKYGEQMSTWLWIGLKSLYYILPNFAALNFKVQAIYGLSIAGGQVFLGGGYFILYCSLVLGVALFVFSRRQFS